MNNCRVYREISTEGADKWEKPTITEETIFESYACFISIRPDSTLTHIKDTSFSETAIISGKKTYSIKRGDYMEVLKTGKIYYILGSKRETPNRSIFLAREVLSNGN